jgi:GTP pyrophosphokinase
MRTIEYLRPEKRQRIALETRDIYAPLAHRLGMASIKRELEDLSLKVLDPPPTRSWRRRIQAQRESARRSSPRCARARGGLSAARDQGRGRGRPKHFYSIYDKMRSARASSDLRPVRAAHRHPHAQRLLPRARVVHDLFTPVAERFKDYIATPKSNLYQSLHTTVLTPAGEMVEVQIRTREMHRIAETGVAAHYVYKQGGTVDEELDARLGGFVAQTADWQRTASDDEYMEYLRTALYQEEVFVYTPRRELKRLPKGATPLDFAFQIHTEVGQRTVGRA